MLAFLDAKGYAERSKRKSFREQFHAILERYIFAAEKIQTVLNGFQNELGTADPRRGDARNMDINDESIDGIIFSPPYSFAIDYLENDAYHLNAIGVDIDKLRKSMVGLRGKRLIEKYENYLSDMDKVISECARILKPGKICSIVVGTNNNQLSKILKVDPEKVKGLHVQFAEMAENRGMSIVRNIERQITGMANTMRTEFIVMLQKD
jgi:SAM-dependent methyltransferase